MIGRIIFNFQIIIFIKSIKFIIFIVMFIKYLYLLNFS